MARSFTVFLLSALLSIATFYWKSEHSFDFHLVMMAGIYFIVAFLLAFQPNVEMGQKLQFSGLALLLWLVLFGVSYNLLFFVIAPIAGGLGAWLITLLSKKYLGMEVVKPWPVILMGVGSALLGIGIMILAKKSATIGIKAGMLTGLWQIGVGMLLAKKWTGENKQQTGESKIFDSSA